MSAAVQIKVDGPRACRALAEVVDADKKITSHELEPGSGLYEIQFLTRRVKMGTGYRTLLGLVEQHAPGASDGVSPASPPEAERPE